MNRSEDCPSICWYTARFCPGSSPPAYPRVPDGFSRKRPLVPRTFPYAWYRFGNASLFADQIRYVSFADGSSWSSGPAMICWGPTTAPAGPLPASTTRARAARAARIWQTATATGERGRAWCRCMSAERYPAFT